MMILPTSPHRDSDDEVVHAIKWAVARRYMQAFAQIGEKETDLIPGMATQAA